MAEDNSSSSPAIGPGIEIIEIVYECSYSINTPDLFYKIFFLVLVSSTLRTLKSPISNSTIAGRVRPPFASLHHRFLFSSTTLFHHPPQHGSSRILFEC